MKWYTILKMYALWKACRKWYKEARKDGKISADEAVELLYIIAGILKFKVVIK